MPGVLIHIDEVVEEDFNSIIRNESFSIGLVIAKETSEFFSVTHLAPLPYHENVENPTYKENEFSKEEECSSKKSKSLRPTSIETVAESEIFMHASQVARMLPGGLDIVGIYICTPATELNNSYNQGKIRTLLSGIHKYTSKYFLDTKESSLEKLVLYGCTQTSKIGVKSFDLSEHGTSLVSGTLKTQETKWIQLNYNYSLSYPIYFKGEKSTQSLSKSVLQSFKPWAKSINNIVILVDGKVISDDEEFYKEEKETPKKKNKQGMKSSVVKVLNLELLENQSSDKSNGSTSEFQKCSGLASFNGNISGRAYITSKEKLPEMFESVRDDLVRTLVSRWEMHCDSLVEEPQSSSSEPTIHEPPRRVFLKVKKSDLLLCDYLFPGDSVSDACQSAKELFSIIVSEDDVNDKLETLADLEELRTPQMISSYDDGNRYKGISPEKKPNAFQFLIGIFIGLLAMVFAYYGIIKR